MASGADGAVASAHKVLGAITQAAVLNVQGPHVDVPRLGATVGMAQTTSPAAFILGSIDAARQQMALHGRELLDRALALAATTRDRLQALPGVRVIDGAMLGIERYDPTKLIVDVVGLGMTGFEVERALRDRFRINPEASDLVSLVLFITIGDTEASVDRLVEAFAALSAERRPPIAISAELRSSGRAIAPGMQAQTPRDAFFAPRRGVPLRDAIGEVAADLVIPYPPGIPVLAPGDAISADKVAYLEVAVRHGVYISGALDPTLTTVAVVDR